MFAPSLRASAKAPQQLDSAATSSVEAKKDELATASVSTTNSTRNTTYANEAPANVSCTSVELARFFNVSW